MTARNRKNRGPRFVLAAAAVTMAAVWIRHEIRARGWFERPVTELSNAQLIYDAAVGWAARKQVDELRARGPVVRDEAVATLHRCPMTDKERAPLPHTDPCSTFAISGLVEVVAALGGFSAQSELRRWLASPLAEPRLREQAALRLANPLHDRESVGGIVELLGVDDAGQAAVYRALREMPAPDTVTPIRIALLRRGSTGAGREEGLLALASFRTEDADRSLRGFLLSEGPDWRQAVIRVWEDRPSEPMPPSVRSEAIASLVSSDMGLRRSSCRTLAGSHDLPRSPEIYATFGPDVCEHLDSDDRAAKLAEMLLAMKPTQE